jgi:hypothetical protein
MHRSIAAAALALCCLATPGRAAAEEGKPISLALVSPIQIVPETQGVNGFRFSLLYGKNAFLTGLDLSLVGQVTGSGTGVQWGIVQLVGGDFTGWQGGWGANITNGKFTGLQAGIFNSAERMEGLQLGFVNRAGTINGLQLGLVNIIEKGGMLPVMVLFNGSFK